MTRTIAVLISAVAAICLVALPSRAAEAAHLGRPQVEQSGVPVTELPGNYIGCVVIPTPSTRFFTGMRNVHAVACVEASTGEVIVAVLRRNGTLVCSGHGYLNPSATNCATVNVCGVTDYYCLF